jgi:hypothetical protein
VREIPLTRGKFAIVDDEDYEEISKLKWCCTDNGYALRRSGDGRNKREYLHKRLIGVNNSMVDHINGDRLDNRKCNLREVTVQQNNFNKSARKKSSSVFKGVYFCNTKRKWRASIRINKKSKALGYHDLEIDAARVYNKAATELFGEYARLNNLEAV